MKRAKGREGKAREGKGRQGEGREGKGSEWKRREAKGGNTRKSVWARYWICLISPLVGVL